MNAYESLFKLYKEQPLDRAFAHFYPIQRKPEDAPDYDEPFKIIARNTVDGLPAWGFQQAKFKSRHPHTEVPKLRNYLNYTFGRLLELEHGSPGKYFFSTADKDWICFNTGLQNQYGVDLMATFQKYRQREGNPQIRPDWVFKGCYASNDRQYRDRFGTKIPDIASYSTDSKDFVFDTSYTLDKEIFDHVFDRAKERSGLKNASDEVVKNYLRGVLENLVPKIRRNYKVAIPVYFVDEKRMQLLLPFESASDANDISCIAVDRDDQNRRYGLKTIFDLDQAYFSARLITRPDKEWLNP